MGLQKGHGEQVVPLVFCAKGVLWWFSHRLHSCAFPYHELCKASQAEILPSQVRDSPAQSRQWTDQQMPTQGKAAEGRVPQGQDP